MAPKRPKVTPSYRKTLPQAVQDPVRPPWRPRPASLVRGTLAVLLVALVLGGWQSYMRHIRAEVQAQKGWRMSRTPAAFVLARNELRRALRQAPGDPRIQNQMALLLLQQESQRAVNRGVDAIDFRNITEALDLLRQAERGHPTPQHLLVKAGEAANLMAVYASRTGDSERQAEYTRIAVDRLNTYRYLHGMALGTEDTFYEIAVRRSFDDGQPNLALTFRDDYELWFRGGMMRNRSVALTSIRAYRQMGEFHLMMGELARLALDDPRDLEVLALIEETAHRHGLERHAILILEELEYRGQLDDLGHRLLESLAGSHSSGTAMN